MSTMGHCPPRPVTGLTTLYDTRDYVRGLTGVDWEAVCIASGDVPVVSRRTPGRRGEQRRGSQDDVPPVVVGVANNFRVVASVVVCDVDMRGTLPQPTGNRSLCYDPVAGIITEVAFVGYDVWGMRGELGGVRDDDGAGVVDCPRLVPVRADNAGVGPTDRSGA